MLCFAFHLLCSNLPFSFNFSSFYYFFLLDNKAVVIPFSSSHAMFCEVFQVLFWFQDFMFSLSLPLFSHIVLIYIGAVVVTSHFLPILLFHFSCISSFHILSVNLQETFEDRAFSMTLCSNKNCKNNRLFYKCFYWGTPKTKLT